MKTFLIQQKIQPLVNQYAVYEANDAGEPGQMVAFAQQKRLAFKEKFTAYTGEDKQTEAFIIEARQVIDFGARYDITEPSGTALAIAGKDFKSSLLRSTWHLFRPGQEEKPAVIAQERSAGLAIVRRLWDFIPIVNEIPFFVKYHFDFTDTATGQIVASYEKTTTLRDHYRLTIQDNAPADLEPRAYIALGIMMDAMQSR